MIFTKKWFVAALVRALRTMAQVALGLIPAAVTITQVDWRTVLGTAALSGLASILMSLAGLPEAKENSDDPQ